MAALLPPFAQVLTIAVALGLLAHQVFRKYETYSISFHAVLLFGPPLLCAIGALRSGGGPFLQAFIYISITYAATLCLSIIVYRLSPLHPLARYPGPLGCKLSKWYLACIGISGFQHHYIRTLHAQYGDVVRIGPNELSICQCDASLINTLYGPSGPPKGPSYDGRILSDKNLMMVGIRDNELHLQRRRPWARGLGQSALKDYEEYIGCRVHQLIDRLADQKGEVIIGNWFKYFSYDLMSDLAFGGGSELLEAGHDESNTWKVLDEGLFLANFFGHLPWFGVYAGKIPVIAGSLHKMMKRCRDRTAIRLQKGPEKKDLFHYLNYEDQPDLPPPPMQQLVDDGILAVLAGADTTSNALNTIVYCLLTHPDVYNKLQSEIDQFYPVGENTLDTKHHREMPYLTAVLNEAMRLYPQVPDGSVRQVPPDGSGIMANDTYLPPGTSFRLHIYSHHRDPRNFSPFPSAFWPERWLLASGELAPTYLSSLKAGSDADLSSFVHNETAFLAFSTGPMNCVGKALAMLEMRMVVCALLQHFRMRLREGWDVRQFESEWRDYLAATSPKLPVVFEAR